MLAVVSKAQLLPPLHHPVLYTNHRLSDSQHHITPHICTLKHPQYAQHGSECAPPRRPTPNTHTHTHQYCGPHQSTAESTTHTGITRIHPPTSSEASAASPAPCLAPAASCSMRCRASKNVTLARSDRGAPESALMRKSPDAFPVLPAPGEGCRPPSTAGLASRTSLASAVAEEGGPASPPEGAGGVCAKPSGCSCSWGWRLGEGEAAKRNCCCCCGDA
jgi:hypothetical protein